MKQRHRKRILPVRDVLAARFGHDHRVMPARYKWAADEVVSIIPGARVFLRLGRRERRLQIRVWSGGQRTVLDFWSTKRRVTYLGDKAIKYRCLALCSRHMRKLRDAAGNHNFLTNAETGSAETRMDTGS